MTFRKLPGLPPYGATAISFPPQWGLVGREGLVVEFTPTTGDVWVGNFQPGIGGLDDALLHPNGRDVLVFSNGELRIVNPTTRVASEFGASVTDAWPVTDPDGYLFDNQGLGFIRFWSEGVLWKSRRISWDGFSDLRFDGERLIGRGWTPIDDKWIPFSLDLRTGIVEGGSYNGPPMEL